ncbi:MAG: hypothetical protein ACOC2M_00690 [bacterium]
MDKDIYQLLKKDVELKFGGEVIRSNDCSRLARDIVNNTRRHVSASTVKRFFGIIKSDYNPSKYTLETFVQYIGFHNWQEYKAYYNKSALPEAKQNTWEILKKRIEIITERSLTSLKLRAGYNPDKVIFRTFAKEKFENFLQSSETATLLTAPIGYGKSVTLIQLVEYYFRQEDADNKDDLVLLIDGGIFFSLFARNPNVDLLHQFVDFNISSSQEMYFQKNPDQRKGRIVILIDNIDEIYFNKEKYHRFLENLMRMIMAYDNGHYKMIFTCRPENVDVFAYLVNKNPILEKAWYDVDFKKELMHEATNVPLFSKDEIIELIQKLEFDFDIGLLDKNEQLFKLIQHPYFLSLFAHAYYQNGNITELTLIKKYLETTLYSPPYQEEKLNLIDNFIEICDRGKETNAVQKKKLLAQSNYKTAYRELISYGIFYEFLVADGLFENNMFVKFRPSVLFEYTLLEKWTQQNNSDYGLFVELSKYYDNNVQLQCNILKLFIKYLAYRKKFEVIEQIQSALLSKTVLYFNNSACSKSVLAVIDEQFSNEK